MFDALALSQLAAWEFPLTLVPVACSPLPDQHPSLPVVDDADGDLHTVRFGTRH
jgi:hypothetical protein